MTDQEKIEFLTKEIRAYQHDLRDKKLQIENIQHVLKERFEFEIFHRIICIESYKEAIEKFGPLEIITVELFVNEKLLEKWKDRWNSINSILFPEEWSKISDLTKNIGHLHSILEKYKK